jgi:subtilisin family serine protease
MRKNHVRNLSKGMATAVIFFVHVFISNPTFSQQAYANLKLSPPLIVKPDVLSNRTALTNIALFEKGKNLSHSFLKHYYGINPLDSNALIGGTLKMEKGRDVDSIASLCPIFSPIVGEIYTFQVSLKNLEKLASHPSVAYVSLARKAEPQLKYSRIDAGIDKVHLGLNLPMPYTGKGILTGLVDVGIEYTNPAFKTDAGDSLRIIKAWAQKRVVGNQPPRFNYGVEFIGQKEILAAQHDSIFGTHGNAVLGAMAGGNYGSNGKYCGAAPGSQIIAISSDGRDNSLLDGVSYFLDEITARNQKGVFNLSWGSLIGPRDGTSLFDQAIDSVVGKGLFVVGAAGNWGSDSVHCQHTSTASSFLTTTTLVKNFDPKGYALLDIWGKPNSSFSVQVNAVNIATGAVTKSTSFYSTQIQMENDLIFTFGTDTTYIYIFNSTKDKFNKKPNSFVAFLHDPQKTNHYISISIKSLNNTVHAWAASNDRFVISLPGNTQPLTGYLPGDNQYSISEIGSTSKSIITAGSHVTQSKYRCILGYDRYYSADSGKRGEYSGQGPTVDGRTKPDLTSGGSMIAPANIYAPEFWINGSENYLIEDSSGFTVGPNTWYWISEEATSFAAPLVTGSIALLLEANPHLTFTQIRDVLRNNATQDGFTGPISSLGSNLWGWGKLNLYKAISEVAGGTITSYQDSEAKETFWYSNPNTTSVVVFCTSNLETTPVLELYDVLGHLVLKTAPVATQGFFYTYSLDQLPMGQYIGSFEDGKSKRNLRVTKVN